MKAQEFNSFGEEAGISQNKVESKYPNLSIGIVSLTFVSSRRNELGVATVGSVSVLNKPYSADSGESIFTWYRITLTNTTTTARNFSTSLVGLKLSTLDGSSTLRLFNGYNGTEVSSISVPANSTVTAWLRTSSYPSSFFYNLPTNDGQSPTEVALTAYVLYNGTTDASGILRTRWNE